MAIGNVKAYVKEEFNLSDKISPGGWIWQKNVKEFIRLLKAKIRMNIKYKSKSGQMIDMLYCEDLIDKLAGEKLI